MKINYSIKLITPALTGQSGIIGKDLDIVTKVDKEGLPYFPGKHIKGIVRDKYEYYGFGNQEEVKKIFGYEEDNYDTKVRFAHLNLSAVYGTELKEIENKEILKTFLFGDRHGISVDRETRTAKENSLFNYQYANPSLEFSSSIEVSGLDDEEIKKLIATLFNIDSIGGQKSRGLGKVNVKVEGYEIKDSPEVLKKVLENKKNNKDIQKSLKESTLENYNFTLEFLEDVILTKSEKGNLVISTVEVNTSAMRGSIISALSNKVDFTQGDIINNIIVTEVKPEGAEILPASFFKTKYEVDGKIEYRNKLFYTDGSVKIGKEESKLERADVKFAKKEEKTIKEVKFEKESEISIAIDRETRSTEEGKLFNFEIAKLKGEKFVGTIKTTKELSELMNNLEIRIGKMKNKGYGKAKITLTKESTKGSDLAERLKKFKEKEFYTLDVITDIILPFRSIKYIGEELQSFYMLEWKFLGDKSYVKVERLQGYSLLNNMPKSDEIVIKAGSVLTYEGEANLDKLTKLEENGIGLRKSEGFGKIEFCSKRHFIIEGGK